MSSFFEFLSGFGKQGESKTEQIQEERSKIKTEMSNNLKKLGFTTLETVEVLNIIDLAEKKIGIIKANLVGSNIDNEVEHVLATQSKAIDDIKSIQEQMAVDIRVKIQEIRARKVK